MRKLILLLCSLLMIGCAGAAVDPYTLPVAAHDGDVFVIPQGCGHLYERDMKIVAVTEFSNNTSYQDGDVKAVSSSKGAVISTQGLGGFSSYSEVSKYVSPQLGEFAQNTIETMIVSLGGATVVSRSRMEAVLQEQQFQMTIADPSTAVELGMLMGAQYIVTGSVDNIAVAYTAPVSTNYDTSSSFGMFLKLGSTAYNVAASGWNVKTTMTVNVIDVSTGKILATHRNEGSASIGDMPTFSVDQIVGGAKKAMNSSMYKTLAFFNDYFDVSVYVNELRGDKKMARFNMGSEQGLVQGDQFQIMNVIPESDFRTGETRCALSPTGVVLTVTRFMTKDSAWASVSAKNKDYLQMLQVGSIAKRVRVRR